MKTKVCITIDTEFSIGGAFTDARNVPIGEQRVWCDIDADSHGLGFILACLARHGITASFFVEALQRAYFKSDPMAAIARRLIDDGHEVQLHLHPCWRTFDDEDWKSRTRNLAKIDTFVARDEDDTYALIQRGQQIFAHWGLPAPTVFRSAGLQHDATLFKAQARAGIPFSSHIGMAIFDSGHADYALYGGRHLRHGVLECPVFTFCDWNLFGKQHLRSLTITGTSFEETRTLLERANAAGVEQVIVLTHPFEYVQCHDFTMGQMRRHRVNQRRLDRLCAYLHQHSERFETCGIGAAASAPLQPASAGNPLLRGRVAQTLPRMVTQMAYQKYGSWRLARMAKRDRSAAQRAQA